MIHEAVDEVMEAEWWLELETCSKVCVNSNVKNTLQQQTIKQSKQRGCCKLAPSSTKYSTCVIWQIFYNKNIGA